MKNDTRPRAGADHNAQFLVLSYDITTEDGTTRTRVYLLNPGDVFKGFGGSRHNKRATKTASLILRQTGPWGIRDTEYDIYSANAWGTINTGLKMAAAQGTLHHVGTVY